MGRHASQYDALYAGWQGSPWLAAFCAEDAQVQAAIAAAPGGGGGEHPLAQPNPWAATDGVVPDSKRYLTRVLGLYGQADGGPAHRVFAACKRIAAELGGDAVATFHAGPLKAKARIFEKARMQGGRLDFIRDYARCMFRVKDLAALPRLAALLRAAPEFGLARAKNRFAPGYSASDSAGYRDYQLLARTPDDWLVEMQVIPEEMYQLKDKLGRFPVRHYPVLHALPHVASPFARCVGVARVENTTLNAAAL